MKKIILAGVAFGALTVGAYAGGTPGFSPIATQALTGDIAIAGGFWRVSDEGSKDDSGVMFSGLARAQYFFMPNWSAQVDINGESLYDGDDNEAAVFNIAAHVGYHTPAWMIGMMLSKGFMDPWDSQFVTIALEGAYRMGPMVLYGQLGYAVEFADSSTDYAWYIHKELAYFLNPNLMLSGDIGIAWFGYSGDTWLRAVRFGIGVEKKFTSSPFGVFARAEGAFKEYDSDNETDLKVKVGVKGYFFNQPLQGGLVRRDFNPFTGVNPIIDP